jgi:hypothetical protein
MPGSSRSSGSFPLFLGSLCSFAPAAVTVEPARPVALDT